jgi:hypothetical protein
LQSTEARLQSTEASFRTTACRFRLAACKRLETLGDSRWFAAGEPAVVASAVLATDLHLVGPTLLIARVAIWLATLFGSRSDLSIHLHAAPRSRPMAPDSETSRRRCGACPLGSTKTAAGALPGPARRVASLLLLIARVPNFRRTIFESVSDVSDGPKQGRCHAQQQRRCHPPIAVGVRCSSGSAILFAPSVAADAWVFVGCYALGTVLP